MRGLAFVILILAFAGYVAFLAWNNPVPVRVHLLFTTVQDVPLWIALLASLSLGAAFAALTCFWPMIRLRLRTRRQNRRIATLEQELHGLRTLPLVEEEEDASSSAREA